VAQRSQRYFLGHEVDEQHGRRYANDYAKMSGKLGHVSSGRR
jgi:hypothetical protein